MTDTVGVTRYTYDDLYRLTQVTDPFTQTISYQYDAANNRTKLTYPDGKLVTYTYNAVNLLATVKDWSAKVTTYTYDVANRLITTTLPNTVLVVNRYDNANRLTQIQQTRTTTVLSRISYTVDPVGNRSKQDEYIKAVESSTGATRPDRDEEPLALPYSIYLPFLPYSGGGAVIEPAATPTTDTITYTYDPLYRVTKANYSLPARTITYTYDAVGNRLVQGDAGKVTTYTYDIANRLTSAGGVAFSWDNNGNLLNDGKSTYTYDQANRLSKVVTGTQTYTMTYNGVSDRLTLSVNGTQTKYANDVASGLTQVLLETTGATKNAYLYGHGHIAQQKTNIQYFGLDGLGSVRQLYNSSGQIVSDRQFDPYGNQMSKTGVGTTNYGFTGEQSDASGLVYLRARYYAPGQGRFVTKDMSAGDYTSPATLHGWNYVEGNPVNLMDPSGQCTGLAGADKLSGALPTGLFGNPNYILDLFTLQAAKYEFEALSEAWQECAKNLQIAGNQIQQGDLLGAVAYGSGAVSIANTVLGAAQNRLAQNNTAVALLASDRGSISDRFGAEVRIGQLGLEIASIIVPAAYAGKGGLQALGASLSRARSVEGVLSEILSTCRLSQQLVL